MTLDALAPFCARYVRAVGDPEPLPYPDSPENRALGAIDVELDVRRQTPALCAVRHTGELSICLNDKDAYWTPGQPVAHYAVNGCNLQDGDLSGTGTLSGPGAEQGGSLLELSRGGKPPIMLSNGESRTFLEDGDTLILRGHCEREGARRIGFGECRGTLLPALEA